MTIELPIKIQISNSEIYNILTYNYVAINIFSPTSNELRFKSTGAVVSFLLTRLTINGYFIQIFVHVRIKFYLSPVVLSVIYQIKIKHSFQIKICYHFVYQTSALIHFFRKFAVYLAVLECNVESKGMGVTKLELYLTLNMSGQDYW